MNFNFTNYDVRLLKTNCVILVLMPFFLVTGPFLPDLLLIVMVFFFLFLILKKKINNFYKIKNILYFFFIFYSILILSSLFSNFVLISLKSSLFYIRFFLFSIFILVLLVYDEKLKNKFFYFLLILFLILIFDCYYQYYYGFNIIGLKIFKDRASSFFGDELVLGGYLVRFLPILISLWMYRISNNKNKNLFFFFIFICLVDLAVIFTGERTAMFVLIFQKIMILIFIPIFRKYFFLNIFSLFFFFLVLFKSDVNLRVIDHTKKYTNLNIIDKNFRPYTSEHVELFSTAFKMGQSNLLLGIGPNNFRRLCDQDIFKENRRFSCSTHPHNFYLQLFAETGVFSVSMLLMVFIGMLKFLFFKFEKNFTSKKKFIFYEYKLLLIGLVTNIFPFATSANFFNNWFNINMYILIGFLLSSYLKLTSKKI